MESEKIQKGARRPAAGLQDLLPAVIAFILIAIVGALGALILINFQANTIQCSNTLTGNILSVGTACTNQGTSNTLVYPAAYNAVGNGITGISTIMNYLPLIALVTVASILIGIVLIAFAFGGNKAERF